MRFAATLFTSQGTSNFLFACFGTNCATSVGEACSCENATTDINWRLTRKACRLHLRPPLEGVCELISAHIFDTFTYTYIKQPYTMFSSILRTAAMRPAYTAFNRSIRTVGQSRGKADVLAGTPKASARKSRSIAPSHERATFTIRVR